MHHAPFWVVVAPTVAMVIGFGRWRLVLHLSRRTSPRAARRASTTGLYRFLLNKWYFDELYDFLFVRPAMALGRFLWKRGDGWLIDGFGPDGVSARVLDVTRNVVRLQTGYLYHYAFAMLLGIAVLVTWMMFAGGSRDDDWPILSTVTFLPLVGAALIFFFIRGDDAVARRNILNVALVRRRSLTFVVSLLDLGRTSTRPTPASSSSRRRPGSAASSATAWASTASRCCSSS